MPLLIHLSLMCFGIVSDNDEMRLPFLYFFATFINLLTIASHSSVSHFSIFGKSSIKLIELKLFLKKILNVFSILSGSFQLYVCISKGLETITPG